jgi:hypothetical protein
VAGRIYLLNGESTLIAMEEFHAAACASPSSVSDPAVSDSAQYHEGSKDVLGRQRHAHYHGGNDAAVLETRCPEDQGEHR